MNAPQTTDQISPAEWERRFKARIVQRCMSPITSVEIAAAQASDPDFTPWTLEEAERAAEAEWEGVSFEDHSEFYENDPEGAADEEMSNWSD